MNRRLRSLVARLGGRRTRSAGAGGEGGAPPSALMLLSSLGLILGKVALMGLGFLSWLLAARLFAPAEVGLASGVNAAVMLCTQVALLGVGSAVIALFPQQRARPAALLGTACLLVFAAALVAAGLFLALASGVFQELNVVAAVPLYTALFLAMSVFGTLGVLFDQTSTSLRRGDQVLVRSLASGGLTLALVAALPALSGASGSLAIFACWVAGGAATFGLGLAQLRRVLAPFRPGLSPRLAREILRVGLPNYLLTLTERAPALVMPIVVTELLSPEANAYWYAVWMMAWIVFVIPIQVGLALFAEAAHRPEQLRQVVRQSIRSSLGLGLAAALGLALLAHVALGLLGAGYAAAGATPLRILVLTVVPFTFTQAYFATARAMGTLYEAIAVGAASGAISVGGAALAGLAYGLTGMAAAWLAAQVALGAWAAFRLWAVLRRLGRAPEQHGGPELAPPLISRSPGPP